MYDTIYAFSDDPREQYPFPIVTPPSGSQPSQLPGPTNGKNSGKTLYILLPVFVILFTLLVLLIVFLIGIIYSKRRRGIRLIEDGGPLDLSRNDGVIGEGGIEGVESRWLEQVSEDVRQGYRRAKGESSVPSTTVAAKRHTRENRLSTAISAVIPRDGYHPFTVPFNTRERRLCVVL